MFYLFRVEHYGTCLYGLKSQNQEDAFETLKEKIKENDSVSSVNLAEGSKVFTYEEKEKLVKDVEFVEKIVGNKNLRTFLYF